jgi:hypothetical protein
MEEEEGYHATMSCTKEKALRQGLSNVWNLPLSLTLFFIGNEWVLVLLDKLNKERPCLRAFSFV